MKTIAVLLSVALLAGCTSKTEFGDCIGIADDRDPTLTYKVSAWNAILGIFFFELIAPPVIVLVNETYCPVGKKK
jgi:hypothetical protein